VVEVEQIVRVVLRLDPRQSGVIVGSEAGKHAILAFVAAAPGAIISPPKSCSSVSRADELNDRMFYPPVRLDSPADRKLRASQAKRSTRGNLAYRGQAAKRRQGGS
jgi:hypothetical protein